MKVGTVNHMKVKRLKRLLGIPVYQAVGLLSTLWDVTAECADEGDIGRFNNDEIADALEWDGDADALVDALVDAGWIDRCDTHRLVVHDWLEHCPKFIRERVRKRHARKNKDLRRRIVGQTRTDADASGQTRDLGSHVPSISNPTQPNPTQPITPPTPPVGGAGGGDDLGDWSESIPESLRSSAFVAQWRDWVQYRRDKGKPLRAVDARTQLGRLAEMGPRRAIEALQHAITCSLNGPQEPKPGAARQGAKPQGRADPSTVFSQLLSTSRAWSGDGKAFAEGVEQMFGRRARECLDALGGLEWLQAIGSGGHQAAEAKFCVQWRGDAA